MRLTIDLDSWWFQDLQNTINKAIELGIGIPAVIRPSPSRKGYHLIWYGINENRITELRKELGDDIRRIIIDEKRKEVKPQQVLFRKKKVVKL